MRLIEYEARVKQVQRIYSDDTHARFPTISLWLQFCSDLERTYTLSSAIKPASSRWIEFPHPPASSATRYTQRMKIVVYAVPNASSKCLKWAEFLRSSVDSLNLPGKRRMRTETSTTMAPKMASVTTWNMRPTIIISFPVLAVET